MTDKKEEKFCEGAVMGLGLRCELEQNCDTELRCLATNVRGQESATNVKGLRCESVRETVSGGDSEGSVMGPGLRCELDQICDKGLRFLATNVRGHVVEDFDERVLGMGRSVGMYGTAGKVDMSLVNNERGPAVTNVRGTWPSRVPGTAKPGSGSKGTSPSVLRRTAMSRTSTSISKSKRTSPLGGRGTSSHSGAQTMAASSSISGVQSLIYWADQLGKQTKYQKKVKPIQWEG